MSRIEPVSAEWEARMLPRCCAAPNKLKLKTLVQNKSHTSLMSRIRNPFAFQLQRHFGRKKNSRQVCFNFFFFCLFRSTFNQNFHLSASNDRVFEKSIFWSKRSETPLKKKTVVFLKMDHSSLKVFSKVFSPGALIHQKLVFEKVDDIY